MVEYTLDDTFAALSDPTRRDILRRISYVELSVGEIAKFYDLTFAAVSKHLKVLERARLIIKKRRGKQQMVSLAPAALGDAAEYIEWYRNLLETRLDSLEQYLSSPHKLFNMHYVYILRSQKDNKLYIGCTNNLERRLSEHNEGKVISTKNRRPFELIYNESFANKSDAFAREKWFKTGFGYNHIRKMLSETLKSFEG